MKSAEIAEIRPPRGRTSRARGRSDRHAADVVELSHGMRHDPVALRLAVRILNLAIAARRPLGLVVGNYSLTTDPDSSRSPYVSVARTKARDGSIDLVRGPRADGETHVLAIEAVGPYDRFTDVSLRVQDHFDRGVRAVVTLDGAHETVTVHVIGRSPIRLAGDDDLADAHLMAGLDGPVRALFHG